MQSISVCKHVIVLSLKLFNDPCEVNGNNRFLTTQVSS